MSEYDEMRTYATGERLELDDEVREPGETVTWRVVGYEGGIVNLSGLGTSRDTSICTAPDMELVRRAKP